MVFSIHFSPIHWEIPGRRGGAKGRAKGRAEGCAEGRAKGHAGAGAIVASCGGQRLDEHFANIISDNQEYGFRNMFINMFFDEYN
jgi:hypothetical protein